jgi:hypothetical protein
MQNPASDVDRHVTSRPLWTTSLDLGSYVRRRHQTVRSTPVSSLWTPDGEHKIDRPTPGSEPPDNAGGAPPDRQGSGRSPAQADEAPVDQADLDEVREQLLAAPVEVVVANHAYGLFELAALHLSAQPPNLEKARLAVDALGAMVEGLEGRLGNVEQALTDALAQIRLAYVQISASHDSDGQQSA